MRLFAALSLPDPVIESLLALQGGVPGARWQKREQLHLTLRFIGEVDGAKAAAIDDALALISAPAFTLELKAVGSFGGRRPHALWAGVAANEALLRVTNADILSKLAPGAVERAARYPESLLCAK